MRLSIEHSAIRFVRYSRLPDGRSRRITVRVLYSTSSDGVAAWAIRHSVPERSFTEDYLLRDTHAHTYRPNRRERQADCKPVEGGVPDLHATGGFRLTERVKGDRSLPRRLVPSGWGNRVQIPLRRCVESAVTSVSSPSDTRDMLR